MFANEQRAPFSLVHYWKWYIFLYLTISPPPFKTKSAATGVAAPKNANSNCRQTKPTSRINTICKSAEQAFLPDFIWLTKIGIGIRPPYKNRAFILKSYLVLFGNFIISQFLRFVNIFNEFLSHYLSICKNLIYIHI